MHAECPRDLGPYVPLQTLAGSFTFFAEDVAHRKVAERDVSRGESGAYGFLPHLDSRPAANLLTQSIATEARQQIISSTSLVLLLCQFFELRLPSGFTYEQRRLILGL